jgi:hypothetical protein
MHHAVTEIQLLAYQENHKRCSREVLRMYLKASSFGGLHCKIFKNPMANSGRKTWHSISISYHLLTVSRNLQHTVVPFRRASQ